MPDGPIYIGGPDRCGKTMLRAFLVSHPRISIPAIGSNLWTYFYGQYGDLHDRDNFERCLTALLRYKHARFLEPDEERLRREFWQGEPGYAHLFALLQAHHAERERKPRWGDQSGLIERYADLIFAAHPDAKMLHMLRDPRDRYCAALTRWTNGKARAGGATARWLYSARLARQNLRKYPGRYHIVRYEELVTAPEATVRGVCAFLDEEFNEEMMTLEGARGYREKLAKSAQEVGASTLISDGFIGCFRRGVPRDEIAFIQSFASAEMRTFGYMPEPISFSRREQWRFMVLERQRNWARMMMWYGMEWLEQKYPMLVGRMPSADKWQ